jgi:hypothetical protein
MQNMQNMLKVCLIFGSIFINGCRAAVTSQNIENSNSNVNYAQNTPPKVLTDEPQLLCDKLQGLKKIPYDSAEKGGDPVYDELLSNGSKVIPCLVEKITDTTVIADPREGDPHIHGFTVGDAAVFTLLIITKQDKHPEKMLPQEAAKNWKTEGIYAYFDFVSESKNRATIQLWWKNWMKENLNK